MAAKTKDWATEGQEGEKDPVISEAVLATVDDMIASGEAHGFGRMSRNHIAQVLIALAEGKGIKWIKDTFGISLQQISRIENRYNEELGTWRDMMRQKYQERYIGFEYAINLMAGKLVERLEKGQLVMDPDAMLKMAKAADLTARTVLTLNGEASQITEQRQSTSPQDVEDWRRKFLESLPEAEKVEGTDPKPESES